MTRPTSAPLVFNGWTLFAHPLFSDHLGPLIAQVEALRRKDPGGFTWKNATKRLTAIARLASEAISQNLSKN